MQKLSQMDMTQERVDELIAYFVGSDAAVLPDAPPYDKGGLGGTDFRA